MLFSLDRGDFSSLSFFFRGVFFPCGESVGGSLAARCGDCETEAGAEGITGSGRDGGEEGGSKESEEISDKQAGGRSEGGLLSDIGRKSV